MDAKNAIHFRLTSDFTALEDEAATSKFFGPTFTNLVTLASMTILSCSLMRRESVAMRVLALTSLYPRRGYSLSCR